MLALANPTEFKASPLSSSLAMTSLSLWIINKDVMLIAFASSPSIRQSNKSMPVRNLRRRMLAPRLALRVVAIVVVVVAAEEVLQMTKMLLC